MANVSVARTWLMRAAFAGLALLIMFFHLLPLDTQPHSWAPPDLLTAFAFAWVLRRPDYAPTLLLAAVMLLADMLFQRPPGLLACLVVLGAEYLKTRAGNGETSFIGEWIAVAVAMISISVLNRFVLLVLGVDQPALGLILIQTLMTIAVYPIVVLITHGLMGVRKLAPSEAEALGARL
jgi:rod shape-determining protein MreD